MKRIYVSLIFILIVAICAALQLGYVSAEVDSFVSMIEQSDKYMRKSEFEEAISVCKNIEEKWDDTAKKIDMLLIHDYVDEIGNKISNMRSYAENCSPDMYFAESTTAKKELASIKESEYPLAENIL